MYSILTSFSLGKMIFFSFAKYLEAAGYFQTVEERDEG